MRIPIISALACIVVALVIAFAMIAVLFVRGDTATYREVSAMVSSEMSSHISGYVNDRPEVYFEATRDSNETTMYLNCVKVPFSVSKILHSNAIVVFRSFQFIISSEYDYEGHFGKVHYVTFEDIAINKGGGMFLNGSFYAPVDGVYW